MWLLLLAFSCGAGLVVGAPTDQEGRSSSHLPMEHRNPPPPVITHADVVGDIFDAMFKSETVSALDEAAARIGQAFGGIIDDIGDFVVGTVREIPTTITKISERVGDAMQNGEEAVVIVLKGIRKDLNQTHSVRPPQVLPANNSVEQVFTAMNNSKTATVLDELDKKLRLNLGRIGGTVLANVDDIDKAIATSIRRVSGAGRADQNTSKLESSSSNTGTLISLDLTESPINAAAVAPSENEGIVAYQSPFTDISSSASNGPNSVLFLLAITQLLCVTGQIVQVR